MRFKIGVFGSGKDPISDGLLDAARSIGRQIAAKGGIVITGACAGIPHQAAVGASMMGGISLGISPAIRLSEHLDIYQFPFPLDKQHLIFTGMGKKGRNVIALRTCDAAIFINGRVGTLNEWTNAYDEFDERKVIGLLKDSGGVVDRIIIPETEKSEKKTKASIIIDWNPVILVDRIFTKLQEG